MPVLSTLITLELESTELHQFHGAPCGEGGTLKVERLYLTRRTQRAQSYFLTVDAGAGGVAVARDGGRRDDERKTENGER